MYVLVVEQCSLHVLCKMQCRVYCYAAKYGTVPTHFGEHDDYGEVVGFLAGSYTNTLGNTMCNVSVCMCAWEWLWFLTSFRF